MDLLARCYQALRRFLNAHRLAIVVLLLAISLLLNAFALKLAIHTSSRLSHEQHATAAQAHEQCVRGRIFGVPLIDHIELVERKLHTGALEREVEWPIGSKKKIGVLKFYRQTIPKSCPLSHH